MTRNTEALKITPWADTGTRATPESTGIDRADGWNITYSQLGGNTIKRAVFNQLLREITGMLHEINQHGILRWDVGIDYQHPAFSYIAGSLYVSTEQHVDLGVIKPNETGAFWRLY